MELIIIEVCLWAGLILFFWALKDGLGNVETDIEKLGLFPARQMAVVKTWRFERPEKVLDPIGSYRDSPIYRYAVIRDRYYRFDHVFPPGAPMQPDEGECCVEPGLVYVPVDKVPSEN